MIRLSAFLCGGRRPEHTAGKHYLIPEVTQSSLFLGYHLDWNDNDYHDDNGDDDYGDDDDDDNDNDNDHDKDCTDYCIYDENCFHDLQQLL